MRGEKLTAVSIVLNHKNICSWSLVSMFSEVKDLAFNLCFFPVSARRLSWQFSQRDEEAGGLAGFLWLANTHSCHRHTLCKCYCKENRKSLSEWGLPPE